MKKNFLKAIIFAGICFCAVAQNNVPKFTGELATIEKGGAPIFVLDLKEYKGAKDTFIFVNHAENTNTSYNAYSYNKKEGWALFGAGLTKNLSDTSRTFTFPNNDKDLKDYDYLAVFVSTLKDGSQVEFKQFSYKTKVAHNDLYFYLLPQDISYKAFEKNATVIDVASLKKKIKDNIRFVSDSKKSARMGFYLFGDNGKEFEFVGTAYLIGYTDTCFVESCAQDFPANKYSRYAIIPADGKTYNYKTQAKSNDLYIYVGD